jgi:hypothetical protein
MAIDFPNSPTVDEIYSVGDKSWLWNGTYWEVQGSPTSTFSASDTAPASPNAGDIWYRSDTSQTLIYYDSTWVEIGHSANIANFLADADADTKIQLEESSDEDTIRFDIAGSEKMALNASSLTVYDSLSVGSGASASSFDASGSGANLMPSGTTAERPASPTAGMIRFNETAGEPEWYSSDKAKWFFFRQSPSVEITGADSYNLVTINGVDYNVLSFNSTATFSVVSGGLIDVMVVGAGGGGGATMGGGGGAGGLVYKASILASGGTSGNITVGAGGLGGKGYNQVDQNGTSGGNSVFSYGALTLTANGGGGGGGWSGYPSLSGGSGGGGSSTTGVSSSGITGSAANQPGTNPSADIDAGNAGGDGYGANNSTRAGGGGGGAGGAGETKVSGGTAVGGVGGVGLDMSTYFTNIFGDGGYFAGGGGGGGDNSGNAGGAGGAGGGGEGGDTADGNYTIVAARNGVVNTGGGGGGLHYAGISVTDGIRYGGIGGSGIVLVRYQA